MPPRLHRRQDTGNLHFITFSCDRRNPYLESSDAKAVFLSVLEETRRRYEVRVFGYVVMPEHVHLLVSEPPGKPLSVAIGVMKREASARLSEKPFWLPRYYDFNVFTTGKYIEKLRYIHRNPVTRGLVPRPEDYAWSSFRAYALLEPGPVSVYGLASRVPSAVGERNIPTSDDETV